VYTLPAEQANVRKPGEKSMPRKRITVREARKNLSHILKSGRTERIGDEWNSLRGFIVGVQPHERWHHHEKKKALKAAFTAAWIAEHSS
jgi:hypothetical protein